MEPFLQGFTDELVKVAFVGRIGGPSASTKTEAPKVPTPKAPSAPSSLSPVKPPSTATGSSAAPKPSNYRGANSDFLRAIPKQQMASPPKTTPAPTHRPSPTYRPKPSAAPAPKAPAPAKGGGGGGRKAKGAPGTMDRMPFESGGDYLKRKAGEWRSQSGMTAQQRAQDQAAARKKKVVKKKQQDLIRNPNPAGIAGLGGRWY